MWEGGRGGVVFEEILNHMWSKEMAKAIIDKLKNESERKKKRGGPKAQLKL
jgi:hypothetical protein